MATAIPYASIDRTSINWLWPHRIPRGKITLIIGDPGVGKSLFTLDLAARLSRGTPFPGMSLSNRPDVTLSNRPEPHLAAGDPPAAVLPTSPISISEISNPEISNPPTVPPIKNEKSEIRNPLSASVPSCLSASPSTQSSALIPQSSLLITAEDTPSDTIRPRLEALNADLSRIYHLDGLTSFTPTDDPNDDPLATLKLTLDSIPNLGLIVIDPISAFLGFTDRIVDRTRTVLSTLADLAASYNAALVLTSRLNKSTPANHAHNSLYRVAGSGAFTTAARAIHLIAAGLEPPSTQPLDETTPAISNSTAFATRIFIPIKHNLGDCPPPLAFHIPGPKIVWNHSPASHAGMVSIDDPLHEALLWLHLALDDGPLPSTKLQNAARENCITKRLLLRAKTVLHVECIKSGYKNSRWFWRLPHDPRPAPIDYRDKYLAESEELDKLLASL